MACYLVFVMTLFMLLVRELQSLVPYLIPEPHQQYFALFNTGRAQKVPFCYQAAPCFAWRLAAYDDQLPVFCSS